MSSFGDFALTQVNQRIVESATNVEFWYQELPNCFIPASVPLPLEDIEDSKFLLEEFLKLIREKPQEICRLHIDDFSYRIDERKYKMNYPITNKTYSKRLKSLHDNVNLKSGSLGMVH
jgi:hypothetical protein